MSTDDYEDDYEEESYGADDGVHALFGADVDDVVWSEHIDDVAPPGSAFVDVVVSSRAPAILKTDRKIALGYFPSGPVVKGVQNYSEGQTVSFSRVPVKPGATLVLVSSGGFLDGALAANVQVTPSGGGQAKVDSDNKAAGNPLDTLAGNLGWGLALVIGGLVLFEVLKGEVKA